LQKILTLLGAVLMTSLLNIAYISYISPLFASQGMIITDLPQYIFFLQIFLSLLPAYWLPVEILKPSQFQIWILYITVYIPAIVVGFHIVGNNKIIGFSIFILAMAFSLFILIYVSHAKQFKFKYLSVKYTTLFSIISIYTVLTFLLLIHYYGMPDFSLTLSDLYRQRSDFKERLTEVPFIVNYMYFWQGIVITPLIIIYGVLRKNIFYIIIGIALQYSLFYITTLRTFLVAIFYIICVAVFFLLIKKYRGIILLYSIILVTVICLYLARYSGGISIIPRIFLQRWLLISGQLSGAYYDFFSSNDKLFWGNSFLKGYVDYIYGNMSTGEVIGDIYVSFGRPNIANATAHFWADAFANAGYLGFFAATVLAAGLLWIIDSIFAKYQKNVAVIMFSMCALSLASQGIQTSILTGGILPLIIIGIMARRVFRFG
jgi:hypothetical protein